MIEKNEDSFFIHSLADVNTPHIGSRTRVWQYSVIMTEVYIGQNCNIGSHTFIENNVRLGDNVTIKNGVFLWDGITLENDVFVGPNVTFTNDKYPRSKEYKESYQKITVKNGASIGANCTILGGVVIGEKAMIGAGSIVTKDIPSGELWVGSPARFVRKIEE
ncbi:acyltransferase [Tenacibaculum xiamenense]|uniref:acyltransferase n=1 Tax=Tenacibaculum xiamenense TaxID=1261553 RepID=UPI00389623CB